MTVSEGGGHVGFRFPGTNVIVGMPPEPWPRGYVNPLADTVPFTQPFYDYPDPPWGPPGTTYLYTLGGLVDRMLQQAGLGWALQHGDIERYSRQLVPGIPADVGDSGIALEDVDRSDPLFLLPGTLEVPLVTVDYVSVQVHAKLGQAEELSHTLALVHTGASAAPDSLDETALTAIANQFATCWGNFWTTARTYFTADVVYDYVKVAQKAQSGPVPKTGSRKGYIKNVGDSVEVPLTGMTGSDTGPSLPYQDALCLSLGTQRKGGRYRGRVYLGPLASGDSMDAGGGGLFRASSVRAIATAFGTNVIAGMASTDWHVNVWSPTANAGREVASVSVGAVPDTIRSRRKSLLESPFLAWGTL